jgi:hypothetical protein
VIGVVDDHVVVDVDVVVVDAVGFRVVALTTAAVAER